MSKDKTKGVGKLSGNLFAIMAVALWAVTFAVSGKLLKICTLPQLIAVYMLAAFVVLFLLSPKFMQLGSAGDELRFAVMGICGYTGTYLLFGRGAAMGGEALMQTAVCFVPITVSVMLCICGRRDRIRTLQALGLVIAFIGSVMTLIACGGSVRTTLSSDLVLVFGGACLLRGVYSAILDSSVCKRPVAAARRTVFWGLLSAVAVMLFTDGLPTFEPLIKVSNIIYILAGGAGGCGIAYAFWNASTARIGAEKSAYYMYLIPAAQFAFSVYVLRDGEFPITAGAGAAVSVIGIILSAIAG